MSMRRNTNNPLLDPVQRPAGAPGSTLPPPPPYSAQGQQQHQQQAAANVYPPPGSQQGYPPPNSQYAPPPGPPPGGPHVGAPAPAGPGPAAASPAPNRNPFTAGPIRQNSVGRTSARAEEDPLTLLKSFDCVFLVDDSSSMHVNEQPDGSIGPSRWEEARDALSGVVELARHYDEDGVDILFLNSDERLEGTKDPNAVRRLFDSVDPNGPTPTGERLEMLLLEYWDILDAYADRKKRNALSPGEKPPKKLNVVVITDGRPTDEPADVIVNCARRLDEGRHPLTQIGIQFLQVGDDPEATRALIELDDELTKVHKVRDMVDTTTYAGMKLSTSAITKALLGGINRRLDRQADPTQNTNLLQ